MRKKIFKIILVILALYIFCSLCFGGTGKGNRFNPRLWRFTPSGIVLNKDSDIMYVFKTVVKTVSIDDDASTDDFQFDDDAANTSEQPLDLGAIVPAYGELVSIQSRCIEAVVGGTMASDFGTSTGGGDILSTADTDALNEINATATPFSPEVGSTNTAKNVWMNATPSANWNTLTAGRWIIMVTYIDYGAVHTQKNP